MGYISYYIIGGWVVWAQRQAENTNFQLISVPNSGNCMSITSRWYSLLKLPICSQAPVLNSTPLLAHTS